MNINPAISLLLWLCIPGLIGERCIPFDEFYVRIETNDSTFRRGAEDRISVSVIASRNADTPEGSTSFDIRCHKLKQELSETGLTAFYEACDAAKSGKAFRKEVFGQSPHGDQQSVYEVITTNNALMVRLICGQKKADFLPGEGDKVKLAIAQAKTGEEWFKKLLAAEKQPSEAPEAKPPLSDGYYFSSKLGEVPGKGIYYGISLQSESHNGEQQCRILHELKSCSSDGSKLIMSGNWTEDLFSKICLAIDAIKKGQEYSFKSDEAGGQKYTVTANLATGEADLVLDGLPNAPAGHFGEKQLSEIKKLVQGYEARKKWLIEHEHLFFSRQSSPVDQERDELGLREYLLNEQFDSYAKINEVCYISFGSCVSANQTQFLRPATNGLYPPPMLSSPDAMHIDPPVEFLTRFAGKHFSVEPASARPRNDTRRSILPIRNPKTGIPDGLYTVEIIEWISNTKAKVRWFFTNFRVIFHCSKRSASNLNT